MLQWIMLLNPIIARILFFLICLSGCVFSVERIPDAFKYSSFENKLDSYIAEGVVLTDSTGEKVVLSDLTGSRSIILNFAYYTCPKLCHLVVNGMVDVLSQLPSSIIKDALILTVSFDHRDTLETTKNFRDRHYPKLDQKYGDNLHWQFLFGDQIDVKRLAESVGFNFYFDSKSKQYSHPSGLIVLSPTGKITRYLYGIMHNSFDVKMSLIEAKKNKSLSTVESMLLFCYNYDPSQKGYVLQAVRLMKLSGLVTVFIMFLLIYFLNKTSKKQ